MFLDRHEACQMLAVELSSYCNENCIIIGIPRGGAVIAYYIAEILKKPWDIIVTRKISAPFSKEVAIGAVTQDGISMINEDIVEFYDVPDEYILNEISVQINEIKRRLEKYKGSTKFPNVSNKTVILVDDGIATGFTVVAAVKSIKKYNPDKIIIAVPVASIEAIDMLKKYVDEIICIEIPKPFISVSQSYVHFEQNTDNEVISLFKQGNIRRLV